jgi:predicted secreted Zn-dependent protease
MNSFQVEQVTAKPSKNRRFRHIPTNVVLLFAALIMGGGMVLSTQGSLTGFAQNLPRPQQVLGEATETARCEGTAYQKPQAIALATVGPGLHYSEDQPQFYTLYASSLDGLRGAVMNCDVRKQSGDHHALTTYTINWQYDTQASAGQCTLTNVKIGLATNQYLPRLAANQMLPTQDQTTWNAYYANLLKHESEHLALDKKYATALHQTLANLSAPCASIKSHTSAIIDSHVALLNSANSLLDTQTNHGADTGALL